MRSPSAWARCAPTILASTRADVDAARQPRRLAFGSGPLPDGSTLELRSGPLADELAALAEEGVQSLLLEGGPTLATAFLEQGLVDKLLVFLAPTALGRRPDAPRRAAAADRVLSRTAVERVGDDVLRQSPTSASPE